jgi:hypothetical protein
MHTFLLIPVYLRDEFHRDQFMHWLRTNELTFHDRLQIYFAWLDHNLLDYSADEIDSLKTQDTSHEEHRQN